MARRVPSLTCYGDVCYLSQEVLLSCRISHMWSHSTSAWNWNQTRRFSASFSSCFSVLSSESFWKIS